MEPSRAERIAEAQTAAAARLALLERQLVELRALRRGQSDDDEHDPDGVPLSEEWSRLEGLREAALRTLADLDTAQASTTDEAPRCMRCGVTIPSDRLAARPQARTCVACAV